VVAPPIERSTETLGQQLIARRQMLEAASEWKDMLSLVLKDERLVQEYLPELLRAQKAWLDARAGLIIDGDLTMDYLRMVDRMAKMYGIELMGVIQRIIEPPEHKAPPLREF